MSQSSEKTNVIPGPSLEGSSSSSNSERRALNRIPFTAAAEVLELRSQTKVSGRCSDLGPGGCYVDTLTPFAVEAPVRIRVQRDGRAFEADAVVIYAHVAMGMGLRFTNIKSEYLDVLREWTAELSGGQDPAQLLSAPGSEARTMPNTDTLLRSFNELIKLLERKKVISEKEAAELSLQMFR